MSRDMTKTNKMAVSPAKTQISLGIHPVWSESSLGADSICWFCHVVAHFHITCSFHFLYTSSQTRVRPDNRAISVALWARARQNQQNYLCTQQWHKSAWAAPVFAVLFLGS